MSMRMIPGLAAPSRITGVLHRLADNARGVVAVEMALVSIPLFTLLFGIIATGQVMWRQNALSASVAQAARCASVNPAVCGTPSQIQSYAASLTGAGIAPSAYTVTAQPCGNQIKASYPLALTIPFVSLSVTLKAQACYPA